MVDWLNGWLNVWENTKLILSDIRADMHVLKVT